LSENGAPSSSGTLSCRIGFDLPRAGGTGATGTAGSTVR